MPFCYFVVLLFRYFINSLVGLTGWPRFDQGGSSSGRFWFDSIPVHTGSQKLHMFIFSWKNKTFKMSPNSCQNVTKNDAVVELVYVQGVVLVVVVVGEASAFVIDSCVLSLFLLMWSRSFGFPRGKRPICLCFFAAARECIRFLGKRLFRSQPWNSQGHS